MPYTSGEALALVIWAKLTKFQYNLTRKERMIINSRYSPLLEMLILQDKDANQASGNQIYYVTYGRDFVIHCMKLASRFLKTNLKPSLWFQNEDVI